MKIPILALVALVLLITPLHAESADGRIDTLDVHRLPLGDGKLATVPTRGYVMPCMTGFHGGGAQVAGPWIHGDTWDLTEKISVQGRITWPQAQFEITTQGQDRVVSRVIRGNGLPVNTPTGNFPVARNDPAFQIDRNPNSIAEQNIVLTLPTDPQVAETSSCVPMGMIGVALNGVAIYNALDGQGRDAVAHEVQDVCNGHPQQSGQYHYHGPSDCLPDQTGKETLVGYALDGFGIYSIYDSDGRELTNNDLDECHGRTSEVEWDGEQRSIYHYVLTREYPYTIGCFRGSPVHGRQSPGRPNNLAQRPGSGRPIIAAFPNPLFPPRPLLGGFLRPPGLPPPQ